MDKQLAKLWFLENYEQSRAPNMSIYKRDLFNKFKSHFNLQFNNDEIDEKNYQIFIDQIHNAMQSEQRRFHLVETKGNTGINAKKRFTHLRKKSGIAAPAPAASPIR